VPHISWQSALHTHCWWLYGRSCAVKRAAVAQKQIGTSISVQALPGPSRQSTSAASGWVQATMPRMPSTGERRELKSIIALCGCKLGDAISALVCVDQWAHTAAEQPERPQSPVTPVALFPRLHTEHTPYTSEQVHTADGPLVVLLTDV